MWIFAGTGHAHSHRFEICRESSSHETLVLHLAAIKWGAPVRLSHSTSTLTNSPPMASASTQSGSCAGRMRTKRLAFLAFPPSAPAFQWAYPGRTSLRAWNESLYERKVAAAYRLGKQSRTLCSRCPLSFLPSRGMGTSVAVRALGALRFSSSAPSPSFERSIPGCRRSRLRSLRGLRERQAFCRFTCRSPAVRTVCNREYQTDQPAPR